MLLLWLEKISIYQTTRKYTAPEWRVGVGFQFAIATMTVLLINPSRLMNSPITCQSRQPDTYYHIIAFTCLLKQAILHPCNPHGRPWVALTQPCVPVMVIAHLGIRG
eukprot:scaffold19591_cov17-Prasinocladus_malaysianus.AAC.1